MNRKIAKEDFERLDDGGKIRQATNLITIGISDQDDFPLELWDLIRKIAPHNCSAKSIAERKIESFNKGG
jgi:hypothetical protein